MRLQNVPQLYTCSPHQLSFDDIVKFGGSFGGTNAKFGNLEVCVMCIVLVCIQPFTIKSIGGFRQSIVLYFCLAC